jgi:predicted ATPase
VLDTVVQVLEPQRLLLVLDNCEHVLDHAAALVEGIARRAPEVVVLATSREGLGITGERLVAVRSLGVDGVQSPAVELFVDRAAQTGWTPAPGELDDVGELCRHLDGVPLAIELAAARARAMSPSDMLNRLGERFRLLKGRRRAIERHQTLRATVGWSYDLLTHDEQHLFDRLSVFTGSFELAAAEDVCADDDLDEVDVDDLLGALVDKSMVTAAAGRFALLETLRQFGEERLAETDDPDRFRHAHLAHYRRFVVDAHDGLWGPDQAAWWTRLDVSWANVRSAFRWAIETDDTDAAITIAVHLGVAAEWHEPHEPYAWAAEVASRADAPGHPSYPACLGIAAMGVFTEGDLARAEPLAEAAVACRSDPSADLDESALKAVAVMRLWRGHTDEAIDLMKQIVEEAAEDSRPAQQAAWTASVAMAHTSAARFDEALSVARRAQALAEPTANPTARSWSRWAEGYALSEPDPAAAVPVLEEALTIADSADVTWVTVSCRRVLAHVYALLGNNTEALELALESVRTCRRQGAWAHVWNFLFYASVALDGLGDAESAARLLGGVSTSAVAGVERVQRLSRELAQRLASELGEETAAALIDEGSRLTPQQAVDLAEAAAAAQTGRNDENS